VKPHQHRTKHRAKASVPSNVAPGGFILAATLWALAAVVVAAAYINGVTETNVENARQTKLMLQAELDRRSTEATLLYLIATNQMTHTSLLLETEQRFGISTVAATPRFAARAWLANRAWLAGSACPETRSRLAN